MANNGAEPEFTMYKKRVGNDPKVRCIDYIWFSGGSLRLAEVLKIPTPQEIGVYSPFMLPSLRFPSDHISLIATFDYAHYYR